MYDAEKLKQLLRDKALKFGDFVLASGKKAKYYCDSKQITLHSAGVRLVGEGFLELLKEEAAFPAAVGGMSIGADPIVASIITMADVNGMNLNGFLVRKEPKGHGTNKYIEGPVQPGDSVVIVEDVVTTGGSSLQAIARAEAFGLKVTGVLAILDRMEGGREAFAAAGYPLKSLFTIRDFGLEPPKEAE
ncbi:MAG: orotate phosphoribosyltransferase [Planctomycetia bacterium]|nr:orotate phosphoribosyltransferase [Planctomycetia bacterium]